MYALSHNSEKLFQIIRPDFFPEPLKDIPAVVVARIFNSLKNVNPEDIQRACFCEYNVCLCEERRNLQLKIQNFLRILQNKADVNLIHQYTGRLADEQIERYSSFQRLNEYRIECEDQVFNSIKEKSKRLFRRVKFNDFEVVKECFYKYKKIISLSTQPSLLVFEIDHKKTKLIKNLIREKFFNSAFQSLQLLKNDRNRYKHLRQIFKEFLNSNYKNAGVYALDILKEIGQFSRYYSYTHDILYHGSTVAMHIFAKDQEEKIENEIFSRHFIPDIIKVILSLKWPSKLIVARDLLPFANASKVDRKRLFSRLLKLEGIEEAFRVEMLAGVNSHWGELDRIGMLVKIRPKGWFEKSEELLIESKKLPYCKEFLQNLLSENILTFEYATRALSLIKSFSSHEKYDVLQLDNYTSECVKKLLKTSLPDKYENSFSLILEFTKEDSQYVLSFFNTVLHIDMPGKLEFLIKLINKMYLENHDEAMNGFVEFILKNKAVSEFSYIVSISQLLPCKDCHLVFFTGIMWELFQQGRYSMKKIIHDISSLEDLQVARHVFNNMILHLQLGNIADKENLIDALSVALVNQAS